MKKTLINETMYNTINDRHDSLSQTACDYVALWDDLLHGENYDDFIMDVIIDAFNLDGNADVYGL